MPAKRTAAGDKITPPQNLNRADTLMPDDPDTSSDQRDNDDDLAALVAELVLAETNDRENALQEKQAEVLGRFYVNTGKYNPATAKKTSARLLQIGFKYEGTIKRWWATEKALKTKDTWIKLWPEYKLTEADKNILMENTE